MIYIGIDNGGNKLGLSLLNTKTKYWYAACIERKSKKSSAFTREIHPHEIWEQMLEIMISNGIDETNSNNIIVGIEEYFILRTKGSDVLPWMQGFLTAKINDALPEAQVVYPGSQKWKRELIGFKTSGKEFVEERVKIKAKNNNIKIVAKNQSPDMFDAMGISYFLWATDPKKLLKIKM